MTPKRPLELFEALRAAENIASWMRKLGDRLPAKIGPNGSALPAETQAAPPCDTVRALSGALSGQIGAARECEWDKSTAILPEFPSGLGSRAGHPRLLGSSPPATRMPSFVPGDMRFEVVPTATAR